MFPKFLFYIRFYFLPKIASGKMVKRMSLLVTVSVNLRWKFLDLDSNFVLLMNFFCDIRARVFSEEKIEKKK